MLDYGSLAAVAAVVREGSFDRAAIALGVTASAVSQRVRALEERLGSVLIVRGQPCTATSAGARICAHVERVRLLEGALEDDRRGFTRVVAGLVQRNGEDPGDGLRPGHRLRCSEECVGDRRRDSIARH